MYVIKHKTKDLFFLSTGRLKDGVELRPKIDNATGYHCKDRAQQVLDWPETKTYLSLYCKEVPENFEVREIEIKIV
jgi:hypothetical protein